MAQHRVGLVAAALQAERVQRRRQPQREPGDGLGIAHEAVREVERLQQRLGLQELLH